MCTAIARLRLIKRLTANQLLHNINNCVVINVLMLKRSCYSVLQYFGYASTASKSENTRQVHT